MVSRRRVGEADAAVLDGGHIHWAPSFGDGQDWSYAARTDDAGRAIISINGLVVRIGDAVVLVDPNSFPPNEELPGLELVPGPPIEEVLAELELAASDITHVLISHVHADHYTAVAVDGELRFPQAEHVFPAADWPEEGSAVYGSAEALHVLGLARAAGRLRLVDGDTEIAPGVHALAAPGESDGHLVFRFDSAGASLYYLADLIHFVVEVEHPDWAPLRRPMETLAASRARVFADAAQRRATVVYTHAPFPGYGRIEERASGYVWLTEPG
jgi:glyoxylase-like metal-dependent hydrolase (beta-lactamase superfamily II)